MLNTKSASSMVPAVADAALAAVDVEWAADVEWEAEEVEDMMKE